MAQAFVTTYLTKYRWNNQPKTLPIHQENLNTLELKGDIWITDFGISYDEKSSTYENVQKEIYKMQMKRMKSTYQRAYCNVKKKSQQSSSHHDFQDGASVKEEPEEEEEHSELLEYCRHLYDRERTEKILPPLEGARTVFGYIRPSRMRFPYSIYQADYGRVGYNVIKSNLPGYSADIKPKGRC